MRNQSVPESEILAMLKPVRFLAEAIAKRTPPNVLVEDLISEGMLAVLQAARRFDPSRGAQFKTYAEKRARGAMFDYLRSLDDMSRGARGRLKAGIDEPPPPPTGIMFAGEEREVYDCTAVTAFDLVLERERRAAVLIAIRNLECWKERTVILNFLSGRPQAETGRQLGSLESRVSQIQTAACNRMRRNRALQEVA